MDLDVGMSQTDDPTCYADGALAKAAPTNVKNVAYTRCFNTVCSCSSAVKIELSVRIKENLKTQLHWPINQTEIELVGSK